MECMAAIQGCFSMPSLERLLSKPTFAAQADSAVRIVVNAFTGGTPFHFSHLSPLPRALSFISYV